MNQSNIVYADLYFPVEPSKGSYTSKGGTVGIPDVVLTRNMSLISSQLSKNIKEWTKDYDFHYAQLQIGVNPDEGYMPQYVKIKGEMNPDLPSEQRPIVQHIFPNTTFVNKNYGIEGEFFATINSGFQEVQSFGMTSNSNLKGEVKIGFKYNPTIPIIDSAASGNIFHWNFRKNGNKIPIGGLDLHMIIARPKKTNAMKVQWIISVKYKKNFMDKDEAITNPLSTDLLFKENIASLI